MDKNASSVESAMSRRVSFGEDVESARAKISLLRKSAAHSTGSPKKPHVLLSKFSSSGSPNKSPTKNNKNSNAEVSKYVNRCNEVGVEPILEVVVSISNPGTPCILSERRRSTNFPPLTNIRS
eukprot:TRINITY_DN8095_c0_g1_i2.p1 TRINITY_DN8095_c0_g1~~TRINITY_DN8095_c0_g1_i2.p1  ORF type:complete len:123 (-),score=30.24 TRINITY_DN8095_c0_g1_i2:189-557(-)